MNIQGEFVYMLQRGPPQKVSRLDILLQKRAAASQQIPKAQNPKRWRAEDLDLIGWIYQHENSFSLFPITGKSVWAKIQRLVNEGPDGPAAKSRELQNGLIFLKQLIEQLESDKRGNQLNIM